MIYVVHAHLSFGFRRLFASSCTSFVLFLFGFQIALVMISSRPWTILAAVSAAFAAPTLDNRQALVDNTLPRGTNPITKFTTQLLGRQVADNSCSHRDLGFTGEIAGSWYAVYGDTLWCAPGVTNPGVDNTTQFHGMVRDSVSLMTRDPLVVQDLIMNTDSPVAHQLQFVPFNAAWNETNTYGFGGTSICEVDAVSKTGMVFYLVVRSQSFGFLSIMSHVTNWTASERKRICRQHWIERRRGGTGAGYQRHSYSCRTIWGPRTLVEFLSQRPIWRQICLPGCQF